MSLAKKYRRVLGIKENATKDQLKKVFEYRFKELHPSRNFSPHALEDFIEIYLAFHYLKQLHRYKNDENDPRFIYWWRVEKPNLEEKSNQLAFKTLEEAVDPRDYEMNNAVNVIARYMLFFFVIGVVIVIIASTLGSLFGTIAIIAFAAPVLYQLGKSFKTYDYSPKAFFRALHLIFTSSWFLVILCIALNIYLFFFATAYTFVTKTELVILFIVMPIFLYVGIFFFLKNTPYFAKKRIISFIITPLLINSFFALNYWQSRNEIKETYHYRINFENNTIDLKDNKYQEYWGIRFFFFEEDIKGRNHITYTIKEGPLGLKVVSDYKLFLSFDNI